MSLLVQFQYISGLKIQVYVFCVFVCLTAGSPQPHKQSWPGTGHCHAHRSVLRQCKSAVITCVFLFCFLVLDQFYSCLIRSWISLFSSYHPHCLVCTCLFQGIFPVLMSSFKILFLFHEKPFFTSVVCAWVQALMFWVVDNFLMKKHKTKAKLEEREDDSRGNSKVRYRRALSHDDSESEVSSHQRGQFEP